MNRLVLVTENDPGGIGTLAEESWSGYTPLAGAAADGPIPPGYGCAHFEKRPYKATHPASGNQVARTFTDHKCRAGFSYVETNLCIQRYNNPRAGDWGNLNCDTDTAVGGVQFRTEIQYDCTHPNSVWAYRNSSVLYTVRNGTAFLDTGYAYVNISYCG